MKKIQTIISTSIFLLAMLFPGTGLSGINFMSAQVLAQPAIQAQVHVVQLPQVKQIKVAEQTSGVLGFSCLFSANEKNSLLQDTFSINLNLPANCFLLSVLPRVLPNWHLAVAVLPMPQVKIVVSSAPVKLSSSGVAKMPFEPLVPNFPLAGFVLAVGFVVLENKVLSKLNIFINQLKKNLSLHQLQVLRC